MPMSGWHDVRVDESVTLPGTADRLVLEPTGDGYNSVIAVVRADGSEGWRAYPPGGSEDAWVDARIDEDTVVANAFSGWLVRLDPESGRELERAFTK